jgi:ribosomal protein S27E
MRKAKCPKCGAENPIYAVSCQECRENIWGQQVTSEPCAEPPPYIGNGKKEPMEVPEDCEVVEIDSKPKTLIMSWICPNCGNRTLVYSEETKNFECCLSEENCGAVFALGRVCPQCGIAFGTCGCQY